MKFRLAMVLGILFGGYNAPVNANAATIAGGAMIAAPLLLLARYMPPRGCSRVIMPLYNYCFCSEAPIVDVETYEEAQAADRLCRYNRTLSLFMATISFVSGGFLLFAGLHDASMH